MVNNTTHSLLSVLIENKKSLFKVVLRVTGFSDVNLNCIVETEPIFVCPLASTHLRCHVFHKLGVVHHPTPVVVNVNQEVCNLVICWEHSCNIPSL